MISRDSWSQPTPTIPGWSRKDRHGLLQGAWARAAITDPRANSGAVAAAERVCRGLSGLPFLQTPTSSPQSGLTEYRAGLMMIR